MAYNLGIGPVGGLGDSGNPSREALGTRGLGGASEAPPGLFAEPEASFVADGSPGGAPAPEASLLPVEIPGVAAPGAEPAPSLGVFSLPPIICQAGARAERRFLEFFTATIRNANTRAAYAQALAQFFSWLEPRGVLELRQIDAIIVASYVEDLGTRRSKPTVKQHLAAIRMLFDWLVTGQVVDLNPAASVRGPSHVVQRGKTPVLSADEARQLLDSIDTSSVTGLRDRALIAVMVFSFARVSAVCGMKVEDYYPERKRWWLRLNEKGGKRHEVPAHHKAEEYLDEYLEVAGIRNEKGSPLFRTVDKARRLTAAAVDRSDAFRMTKRRAKKAGLSPTVCCHTFRATGITAYLENGGTIENAQAIAAHASPRTTKLYDRTSDDITLEEVERIRI